MRQWINLFENAQDPTALAYQVRDELLAEAGVSAIEFNSGQCMEYADELTRRDNSFHSFELGNFYNHPEGSDCNDATGFGEKWLSQHPEWQPPQGLTWQDLYDHYGFNWTGMHIWAWHEGTRLCYDVERPDGVRNVFDLPFFQRVIASGPIPIREDVELDDDEQAMADYRSFDRTQEEWAYHCTFLRNVESIARNGLTAGNETNFDFSKPNAIYGSSEDGAQFYALELEQAYGEETTILRFPMPHDAVEDEYGNLHDFHTNTPVPPEAIEIQSEAGGQFIPIRDFSTH